MKLTLNLPKQEKWEAVGFVLSFSRRRECMLGPGTLLGGHPDPRRAAAFAGTQLAGKVRLLGTASGRLPWVQES